MKKKCIIHKWNGCTCSRCGKKRDEGHSFSWVPDWEGDNRCCYEKCSICGKIKTEKMEHDYSNSAGQCFPVCSRCRARTVYPRHQYQKVKGQCIERCRICGDEHKIPHIMKGRKNQNGACEEYCSVCGYTVPGHVWHNGYYGCICDVCGETNPNGRHQWKIVTEGDFTDIKVCSICGKRDESEKCTIEESKIRREIEAAMEAADSLHEMRAKGIKC